MRSFVSILTILAATPICSMAIEREAIAPKLEVVIREEMREWGIGGVSVALVDDGEIVYSKGFGEAKSDSIFRAGSISKLFNAVAVMQQVEQGKLDLDAPIPADLLPINPFPEQLVITLRHLLSHRSGLLREAPVGHYLDGSEPGIRASVESIRSSVLVTKPGEKTRYSNIAPTLAGFLVERSSGRSFEEYQAESILRPLGMNDSSWTRGSTTGDRVIVSHMRVADGAGGWVRREAPLFDLGTIPAGNLFTTVDDLARFAIALIRGGEGLLAKESLNQMWTPQFTDNDGGFGLGFMVGRFHGRRTVEHSGAVYGHSTSFVVLPEEKLAVVVIGNEDIANGRIHRIHRVALSQMINAKFGDEIAIDDAEVQLNDLGPFTGEYESQSYWARLEVRDGRLVGDVSGQPTRFRATGELTFKADNRISDSAHVAFEQDDDGLITGFTMSGQNFRRVPKQTVPLPDEWRRVLGSYGPDFIPIIITERHGHLYAMTENMVDYRLNPVNRHVCALPPGMYVDEEVVFLPGENGVIHAIDFANMIFRRNP